MQIVKYQNFNKKIIENFDYDFDIDKRGLYAISITARCRSGKQVHERGGEDLRVEIDGQKFREIPPEKNVQLYNIPSSWNGTKLKGLKKTVVFISWLEKNNHKITFIPRKEAKLEDIKIEFVNTASKVEFNIEEQAEFKIQIDNTLFYYLDWLKNGGFIKLKLLLIGLLLTAVLFAVNYIVIEIDDLLNNSNMIISDAAKNSSTDKHFFINPVTKEIDAMYFDKDGDFLRLAQITYDGYPKSSLKVSSSRNGNTLGFFQKLHREGEEYDLDDDKVRQEYYDNYVALMIMNNKHGTYGTPKEVYRGDMHTSYWKWGVSGSNHVIVYYNCGTGCLYAYEINVETKEIESEYHVE